jgi:LCP family protein required for cell wall assembly
VLGYFNTKLAKLQRFQLGTVLSHGNSSPGSPQNYLLVGTDSDLGLNSNDPAVQGRGAITGARSDTIMILHVDPRSTKAQLISLPRDLWVTIAGSGTQAKINAAIEVGGPAKLIQTIQDNFGIPINHYVEVDFNGFEKLVKAVGGIPIYFNTGFRDYDPSQGITHTGFEVDKPGCYTLDPQQALAYARTRYAQYQSVPGDTTSWVSDGVADLGRISRQQDFMKRALSRAVAKGIRDPQVLNSLVNAGLGSVVVDQNLTVGDVLSVGSRFKNFDPNSLKTIELPVDLASIDGQSALQLHQPDAQRILDLFKGEAAAVGPSTVSVEVLNGTGRYNEATDVTTALAGVGFQTGQPGDANGVTGADSLIRYSPGQEAQARLLARYLDSSVTFELQESSSATSGTSSTPSGGLTLITGTSYKGVLHAPKPAAAVPGPTTTTSTSTTSTSVAGSTATTAPSETTTTVSGFVPDQLPPGKHCG